MAASCVSTVAAHARVRGLKVSFLPFNLASSLWIALLAVPVLAFLYTHRLEQEEFLAFCDIEGHQANLLV